MKEIKQRSDCPISFTLDFIGDKWTLLILRDIMLYDKSSYNEFLKSDEKIATNILADRLEMLQNCGFIMGKTSVDKKSRTVYSMTEKAIDLVPLIIEYNIWGAKYNSTGNPGIMDEILADKNGTIEKFQNKLRNCDLSK